VRWPLHAGRGLHLPRDREGGREGGRDLRRVDPRQDRARCGNVRAGQGLSALRLRAAQGLCRAGAPGGAQAARPLRDPPQELRAGGAPAAARPAVLKSITSRDNPAYKAMYRLVAKASERRASGKSVLDGAHLLAAFLDSGRAPEDLMVNRAGAEDPEIAAL